jgi:hypothetical protein
MGWGKWGDSVIQVPRSIVAYRIIASQGSRDGARSRGVAGRIRERSSQEMRYFARTSLGMLALGLIAPITASAQYGDAAMASGGYLPAPQPAQSAAPDDSPSAPPAGYQSASAVRSSGMTSAKPGPASTAPASTPELKHIHRWRTICPACAAKSAGPKPTAVSMPPGRIVGCAHSSNGVCTKCKALLEMPGTFVQAGTPAADAPGRAVVSNGESGKAAEVAEYGPMAEPAPVGVVQAGYAQSYGTMPMQAPAGMAVQTNAPGKAVAEATPTQSRDFYHEKSNNGFPHPHILGHLFGWSGIGSERREQEKWKKAEAHARETYDPNAPTGVSELPASSVFGKQK